MYALSSCSYNNHMTTQLPSPSQVFESLDLPPPITHPVRPSDPEVMRFSSLLLIIQRIQWGKKNNRINNILIIISTYLQLIIRKKCGPVEHWIGFFVCYLRSVGSWLPSQKRYAEGDRPRHRTTAPSWLYSRSLNSNIIQYTIPTYMQHY